MAHSLLNEINDSNTDIENFLEEQNDSVILELPYEKFVKFVELLYFQDS